jgi:hypothetical protein
MLLSSGIALALILVILNSPKNMEEHTFLEGATLINKIL